VVVIFRSPLFASVPSALIPAASTPVELLLRLFAERVALPCAAINPVLVIAPEETSDKSEYA
ncbi:MAG: hypothetical protein RL285_1879, partial [Bacteroidota bacterium]